jgi:hypothetical protein
MFNCRKFANCGCVVVYFKILFSVKTRLFTLLEQGVYVVL